MKRSKISLPLLYVVSSPLVPISVRYLSVHLENFTQNFLRMGAGAIGILLVTVIFFRGELLTTLRSPRAMLLLVVFSISGLVGQYAVVEGLTRTSAAMGGVIAILGAPLTLFLAAMFYRDEREIATDRRFIIGTAVAIAGTIGISLTASGAQLTYSTGILWLLLAVTVGAFATVLLKHLLTNTHPFAAGTITSLIIAAQFLFLGVVTGGLGDLAEATPMVITIALLSGVIGLLIGVALHFVLIKRIGISKMNVLRLVIPVLTAGLGYLLIDDKLTVGQMGCGLVVIAGCWLCFSRPVKLEPQERN